MGCILKGSSGLWSRLSVGAVVLATGHDERLDHPAALLELAGVPLVLRQLIALSGAGVDELAVVLGRRAAEVEPVLQSFPIHVVHDPAPERGPAASLRLGLERLSPRLDAVIVSTAALPWIDGQDVTALIGGFKKRGDAATVVLPRSADGRAGAALIADAGVRDRWLAEGVDERDLHGTGEAVVRWLDVAHPRLHTVIRGLEDVEAFARTSGHRLGSPANVDATPAGRPLQPVA